MSFFAKDIRFESVNEVLESVVNLRAEIVKHKVVLIRGLAPLDKNKFLDIARFVSGGKSDEESFIKWNFGHVMELKELSSPENYLFSNEKVPFHWDGAFHETPSILAFNCIEESSGGRTLFSDTQAILRDMSRSDIEIIKKASIGYKTEKLAHYGGSLIQKIIDKHPVTRELVLRLGEKVETAFNPVSRDIQCDEVKRIVSNIEQDLYRESYCYAHQWKRGDLLFADNHSLLHGRESYTSSSTKRHIRRIQIK